MAKKTFALTGPSIFTSHCISMIENHFNANFVYLNQKSEENYLKWVKNADALIVAGGVDIHPSLYNEQVRRGFSYSKFDYLRDCLELKAIELCIKSGKPLLCICRGHQLLGIYFGLGGNFIEDLHGNSIIHQPNGHDITADEDNTMHCITITNEFAKTIPEAKERNVDSLIYRREKKADDLCRYWINSFHHQAIGWEEKINYNKRGIEVLGLAAVIWEKEHSIIELMRGKNWVSCQWHPEYDYQKNTLSRKILDMFGELLENTPNQEVQS